MKQFMNVFQFELANFVKSKGYIISLVVITLIFVCGLSVPSFIHIDGLGENTESESENNIDVTEDEGVIGIYNEGNITLDQTYLETMYPMYHWNIMKTEKELRNMVEKDELQAAYIIHSEKDFTYVVYNSSIDDSMEGFFQGVMSSLYRYNYATENDLNYYQIEGLAHVDVTSNMDVLGKDSASNWIYVYILFFVLYFIIIMYGQMIGTNVATEKSNRAIEVLVTSTTSNSLIFGKVIAGAVASLLQLVVFIGASFASYAVNRDAWGGLLDVVFDIPIPVLITFLLFGIMGFLFYCFIYGALGALVSKVEDLSKSTSIITIVYVVVFYISFMCLADCEGTMSHIASFVPFSSSNVMFLRVAMGTVSIWEVALSFAILTVSTIIVGALSAKIYRMGTLHYGNPIKLSTALKKVFKKE